MLARKPWAGSKVERRSSGRGRRASRSSALSADWPGAASKRAAAQQIVITRQILIRLMFSSPSAVENCVRHFIKSAFGESVKVRPRWAARLVPFLGNDRSGCCACAIWPAGIVLESRCATSPSANVDYDLRRGRRKSLTIQGKIAAGTRRVPVTLAKRSRFAIALRKGRKDRIALRGDCPHAGPGARRGRRCGHGVESRLAGVARRSRPWNHPWPFRKVAANAPNDAMLQRGPRGVSGRVVSGAGDSRHGVVRHRRLPRPPGRQPCASERRNRRGRCRCPAAKVIDRTSRPRPSMAGVKAARRVDLPVPWPPVIWPRQPLAARESTSCSRLLPCSNTKSIVPGRNRAAQKGLLLSRLGCMRMGDSVQPVRSGWSGRGGLGGATFPSRKSF